MPGSFQSAGSSISGWVGSLVTVTLIGVFSKESAAAILGAIVLYELVWWQQRRQGRALAAGCVTVILALGAMAYARGIVFGKLPPTQFPYWDNPLVDAGIWTARLTALKVIAKCLGLLVWPAQLSCDYTLPPPPAGSPAPKFGQFRSFRAIRPSRRPLEDPTKLCVRQLARGRERPRDA